MNDVDTLRVQSNLAPVAPEDGAVGALLAYPPDFALPGQGVSTVVPATSDGAQRGRCLTLQGNGAPVGGGVLLDGQHDHHPDEVEQQDLSQLLLLPPSSLALHLPLLPLLVHDALEVVVLQHLLLPFLVVLPLLFLSMCPRTNVLEPLAP